MTSRTLPDSDILPRALYTAEQTREFDRLAIERFGIAGETLMERAGAAACRHLRSRWPEARRIVVVVGTGSNGGDGFVLARHAAGAGLDVEVLQVGHRARLAGDARLNADRWRDMGGEWRQFDRITADADVLVDALLGTGLEHAVEGQFAEAIEAMNRHRAPCLAADIPSGLHADSGCVLGTAVRADTTVCFIGLKQGLFTADGPDCAGVVIFEGLGVPAAVYASSGVSARRIDWDNQSFLLPSRRRNTHKGHFGHVLVIGGNNGLGGAASLAAQSALRSGAGLVSLVTREAHVAPVLAARPEIMVHAEPGPDRLAGLLRQARVIAIGPGLGTDDWAAGLWSAAVSVQRPMVVDADALRLMVGDPTRRDDWVLTPHPGEAAEMLGQSNAEVSAQRFRAVDLLRRRFGGTVVLKGAGSLIAGAEDLPVALCSDGNPGMSTAGMGDVLTGVIAALIAQGLGIRDAAESGVCLHAAAADRLARQGGERGLLAGDVIAELRSMVNAR